MPHHMTLAEADEASMKPLPCLKCRAHPCSCAQDAMNQWHSREIAARVETRVGARPVLSEHVQATIDLLEIQIAKLRTGTPREEVGREIELIGRVLARRT